MAHWYRPLLEPWTLKPLDFVGSKPVACSRGEFPASPLPLGLNLGS